jgi:hypothetical protein
MFLFYGRQEKLTKHNRPSIVYEAYNMNHGHIHIQKVSVLGLRCWCLCRLGNSIAYRAAFY